MHTVTRTIQRSPRRAGPGRALPALGLAALLGACSTPEAGFLDPLWSPFAGTQRVVAPDSVTVQRVRGGNPEVAPLTAEPGNVWPEPEAPRAALLGGPEEAMRNIPEYRPSLIQGSPPARSPVPTPGGPQRGLPSSSLPPPPSAEPPRAAVQAPAFAPTPPPRRREGEVAIDPFGRPAVITGDAGRVSGFTQPGIGGGAVIRDGNVETWIGPDGQARTRLVTPR
jgi:hypothetical protein